MSNTPLTYKDLDEAYRQMTDYKRIGEREKFNHEHQLDGVADALKRLSWRRRLQDILCAIVFIAYYVMLNVAYGLAALFLRLVQWVGVKEAEE
jgi:hypothetical protein